MSLNHPDLLITNLCEFLRDKSFYKKQKIESLENTLFKYINSKGSKQNNFLLSKLEKLILEDNIKYKRKLFKVKVKYAANSPATEEELFNRHIWIIRSVISRLKKYIRGKKKLKIIVFLLMK